MITTILGYIFGFLIICYAINEAYDFGYKAALEKMAAKNSIYLDMMKELHAEIKRNYENTDTRNDNSNHGVSKE